MQPEPHTADPNPLPSQRGLFRELLAVHTHFRRDLQSHLVAHLALEEEALGRILSTGEAWPEP